MNASTRTALLVLGLVLACLATAWFLVGEPPGAPSVVRDSAPAAGEAATDGRATLVGQSEQGAELPRVETRSAVAAEPAPEPGWALLTLRARAVEDGAALPGVSLTLRAEGEPEVEGEAWTWLGGSAGETPVTDAGGSAHLRVRTGVALEVYAWFKGVDSRTHAFVAALSEGEERELELSLATRHDVTVLGRVVELESRAPVMDALVQCVDTSERTNAEGRREALHDVLAESRTNARGEFQLSAPSWKLPHGRVIAEGYGVELFSLERGHETRADERVVELRRSARVDGQVQADEDLQGFVVRARVEGWPLTRRQGSASVYVGEWTLDAAVDAQGAYSLEPLPADVDVKLELRQGTALIQERAAPLRLAPGERATVDWSVGRGTTVFGSAVLAGSAEPLAGHPIWLLPAADQGGLLRKDAGFTAETTTAEDGRFRFDDVGPGTWMVGPAPVREEWEPAKPDEVAAAPVTFVLQEGLPRADVRLEVHRGLFIEGRVIDADGKSVRKAYVNAHSDGAGVWLYTSTVARRFRLGPLVPGEYTLQANASGIGTSESEPVTARPGARDVVLQLGRGGGIRGRMLLAGSGEPVSGEVLLSPEGGGGGWVQTVAQPDGSFRLDGQVPGTYSLLGRSGGLVGLRRGLTVVAGEALENVELVVERGATLVVRSLATDSSQWCTVEHEGVQLGVLFLPGGGEVKGVFPPGSYLVRLHHGGEQGEELAVERAVDLFSDADALVEFGEGDK